MNDFGSNENIADPAMILNRERTLSESGHTSPARKKAKLKAKKEKEKRKSSKDKKKDKVGAQWYCTFR